MSQSPTNKSVALALILVAFPLSSQASGPFGVFWDAAGGPAPQAAPDPVHAAPVAQVRVGGGPVAPEDDLAGAPLPQRETKTSSLFTSGLPLLAIAAAVLGYRRPRRKTWN